MTNSPPPLRKKTAFSPLGLIGRSWLGLYIKTIMVSVLIITTLLVLGQIIYNLPRLITGGFQWLTIIKIIIFYAPYGMMLSLPIVLAFAVFFVLRRLLENHEALVIMGGGVSYHQLNKTILLLASGGFLLLLLLKSLLAPLGQGHYKDIKLLSKNALAQALLSEGKFLKPVGDKTFTIYVHKKYFNGILEGVFILDNQDPQNPEILTAQKGVLQGQVLTLHHGIEYFLADDRLTSLTFDRYSFNLATLQKTNRWISNNERTFLDLWHLMKEHEINKDQPQSLWYYYFAALLEQFSYSALGIFLPLISAQLLWRSRHNRQGRYGKSLTILVFLVILFMGSHIWTYENVNNPRLAPVRWWWLFIPPAGFVTIWLALLWRRPSNPSNPPSPT